jgi:hypothetical protein
MMQDFDIARDGPLLTENYQGPVSYPMQRQGEVSGSFLIVSSPSSFIVKNAQGTDLEITGLPQLVFARVMHGLAVAMAKDNAAIALTANQKKYSVKTGDLSDVACQLPDNAGKIFLIPHEQFITIGAKKDGGIAAISINRHFSPNTFVALKGFHNIVQRLSAR